MTRIGNTVAVVGGIARELIERTFCGRQRAAKDREAAIVAARKILGAQSLVAVDVGAANGLLPHWEAFDGIAEIIQVEPREDACRELERTNAQRRRADLYRVVSAALSEHGGLATLHVSNAPTGSSLLKIDPSRFPDDGDYVDQTYLYPLIEQRIETETLGDVLDRLGETSCDLIKLDVQGSELPILRGLDETRLAGILAVELEVGLHDLYPDDVGFGSVLAFMKAHGLELLDIRVARVHRPLGNDHEGYQRDVFAVHGNSPTISARAWEFDAVFFRRKSSLLGNADAGAIRRMILAYCTYNFYSEAHSLVDKGAAAGFFSSEEAIRLKDLIVEIHRLRHFRSWLADDPTAEWLRRIMHRIAPRSAPRWCQYMYQNYPNG